MGRAVLMICYYYPPLVDVGARRSVGFATNLRELGWSPQVLCVKNPDTSFCILGNESPPLEIPVDYVRSIFNPFQSLGKLHGVVNRIVQFVWGKTLKKNYFREFFCLPDHFIGWIPGALWRGHHIIRKQHIDVVYVSCEPFSAAVIGVFLKKINKKKLVIDFRDPFTVENVRFAQNTAIRKKILKKIEKWILRNTDAFIVTSEEARNQYIREYSWIIKKIYTVHNGVDFSAKQMQMLKVPKYKKFTIIYAGLYFYTQNEWDPEFVFQALELLNTLGCIDPNTFQFLFFGEGYQGIAAISERFGLQDYIYAYPRINYEELAQKIRSSHLQLLRTRELAIPAKFFDGIVHNVPFLATIPEGETAELVRKYSPSSYVIPEQKPQPVADAILDAIKKYKQKEIENNAIDIFLNEFSRKQLTKKFMHICERL